MQINISVDDSTSFIQFTALAALFNTLAVADRSDAAIAFDKGVVVAMPQPRVTDVTTTIGELATDPAPVVETPAQVEAAAQTKRSRRTKAEIEADKAKEAAALEVEVSRIAEAEAAAYKSNEAELAKIEAAEVINTEIGEITQPDAALGDDTPADEFETNVGEKAFTEAEVQQLATLVARTKGPDVVKGKIAELGAARISMLTAAQLNQLGAFLEAQK